jgi:hypothetical protein
MAYSDEELMVVAQLAYYDFSPDSLNGKDRSIQTLLEKNPQIIMELDKAHEKALNENASANKISKLEAEIQLFNDIKSGKQPYSDWVVKDIKDDNNSTGFYGLLVETGKDRAIVGFRGSEGHGSQFEKDWVNADFAMLNSISMDQQDVATDFMAEINQKYHYDQYATTGHSLGGNLSFHGAITAPADMRAKITQALNADGPGFSGEYLANPAYADGLKEMSGKMDHYQWSLVGAILNPVPGAEYRSIRTNELVYGKYDLDSLTTKHSIAFVEYDENGRIKQGEMDAFAASIGKFSREADESPAVLGDSLVIALKEFMAMPDDQKKKLGLAVIANIGVYAVTHPVQTVAVITVAATLAVVGWINPEFFGEVLIPVLLNTASFVADMGQKLIDGITAIVKTALETYHMAKETVSKIVAEVNRVVTNFISWIKKGINAGYRYASQNPVIKVDTYKLRNYADRLQSVNSRINSLDRRMNSLYWNAGFLDLLNLVHADLLTSESWRLKRCISYLDETATSFEAVERKIMNNL